MCVCVLTEQCLRDEEKALFGTLTSRQSDCLSALVKFSAVCSQVITSEVVKRHCVTLLSGEHISKKNNIITGIT